MPGPLHGSAGHRTGRDRPGAARGDDARRPRAPTWSGWTGPSGRLDLAGRADDYTLRSRRSVAADLKTGAGRDLVLRLAARADVLLEGLRPGVAERLGVGPQDCQAVNPALVYGRMTGWGQDGPMASQAGHDINYISLTGALHAIGPAAGPPSRSTWSATRRRLHVPGDRRAGRAVGAAAVRHRAGGGHSHGRRCQRAAADVVGLRGVGAWTDEREAQPAGRGRPVLRHLRLCRRPVDRGGRARAAVLRAFLAGLGIAGEDLPGSSDRPGGPGCGRASPR